MKIEAGKRYAFHGKPGTAKYIDGKRKGYPVLFESDFDGSVTFFDENGNSEAGNRLEPYHPLIDLPIDSKICVSNSEFGWNQRHFAGIAPDGEKVLAGADGFSSWTIDNREPSKVEWSFYRLG